MTGEVIVIHWSKAVGNLKIRSFNILKETWLMSSLSSDVVVGGLSRSMWVRTLAYWDMALGLTLLMRRSGQCCGTPASAPLMLSDRWTSRAAQSAHVVPRLVQHGTWMKNLSS